MEEMTGADNEEQWATAPALSQRGGGKERARPCADPYVKASFLSGAHQAPVTFSEELTATRRLVMKRKVLRHRPDGGVEVFDESVCREPKVWKPRLQLRNVPDDSISEGEIETSSSSSHDESSHRWPHGDTPSFLLEDFSSQRSSAATEQPKSFIPPQFVPLGQNWGKTDRVARYFEYKREWERFGIPGEDQHLELRWAIRQQMLCQPELSTKPRHLYAPNLYVVPTEKKRAALRWAVRWDLAQGFLPRKNIS